MSTTRAIEEYFGKTPEELSRMWRELCLVERNINTRLVK